MSIKDWVFVSSIAFGIISSGYASYQRDRAISAELKLKESAQIERIDTPYNDKVSTLESEIDSLSKEFAKSMAEAAELRESISHRDTIILTMNAEIDALSNKAPVRSKMEEKYEDADAKDLCAGFTNYGYDCFLGGTKQSR